MANSGTIVAVVAFSLCGAVACSNRDQGAAPVAPSAPNPPVTPVPPPAPLVYECRANGTGSPTYMKFDEQAKTVSLGREKGVYMVTWPAFFNKDSITWSHAVEGQNWNYTFDRSTGYNDYGWGTPDKGFSQRDFCKPI